MIKREDENPGMMLNQIEGSCARFDYEQRMKQLAAGHVRWSEAPSQQQADQYVQQAYGGGAYGGGRYDYMLGTQPTQQQAMWQLPSFREAMMVQAQMAMQIPGPSTMNAAQMAPFMVPPQPAEATVATPLKRAREEDEVKVTATKASPSAIDVLAMVANAKEETPEEPAKRHKGAEDEVKRDVTLIKNEGGTAVPTAGLSSFLQNAISMQKSEQEHHVNIKIKQEEDEEDARRAHYAFMLGHQMGQFQHQQSMMQNPFMGMGRPEPLPPMQTSTFHQYNPPNMRKAPV